MASRSPPSLPFQFFEIDCIRHLPVRDHTAHDYAAFNAALLLGVDAQRA